MVLVQWCCCGLALAAESLLSLPADRKKVPGFTQATDVMALPPPPTKVEQATKTRKTTRKPSISPESGKSRNSETKRTNLEKKGDSNKSRPGQVVSFQGSPPPERVQSVRDPADRRRPSGSCREGHKRGSGSRGMETEEQVLLVCESALSRGHGRPAAVSRRVGPWQAAWRWRCGRKGDRVWPHGAHCGLAAATTPTSAGREDGLPAHGQPSQFSRLQTAARRRLPPTSGDSPARVRLDFSCLPVCFQWRHGREKTQSQGRAPRAPRLPPPPHEWNEAGRGTADR